MSIWSSIGKVVGGVGGFIAGGPAGAVAGYKGAEALFDSPRSAAPVVPGPGLLPSTMRVPTPAVDYSSTASASGGFLPEVAGTVVGGIISHYLPGGSGGTSGGGSCGCAGSRRDPCTHQVIGSKNHPAPLASFFGGCCPPGRTLRRKPMARDVCIKTPRMNPFNPRALARADRRVTTFARRAAPLLKDMGFDVSRHRRPKHIKLGRGKRHHARG